MIRTTTLCLALFSATSALAQDAATPGHGQLVDSAVSTMVEETTGKMLSPEQLTILKSIAHQLAVTTVCPGFAVDEARRSEELMRLAPTGEGKPERTPEESAALQAVAVFAIGAHMGATMAVAINDEAAFCAHAEEERAEPGAHLIYAPKS